MTKHTKTIAPPMRAPVMQHIVIPSLCFTSFMRHNAEESPLDPDKFRTTLVDSIVIAGVKLTSRYSKDREFQHMVNCMQWITGRDGVHQWVKEIMIDSKCGAWNVTCHEHVSDIQAKDVANRVKNYFNYDIGPEETHPYLCIDRDGAGMIWEFSTGS